MVLIKEVDEMLESVHNRVLDFINIRYVYDLPKGGKLIGEEAIRASKLSALLKSTIMTLIIKNRETRKVPKLKEILQQAISREKKEQAFRRQQERVKYNDIRGFLMESVSDKLTESKFEMVLD